MVEVVVEKPEPHPGKKLSGLVLTVKPEISLIGLSLSVSKQEGTLYVL